MRAVALALSVLVALLCAPAQANAEGYAFTILRGDSPIGTYRVAFSREGDTLTVDLTSEIAVKVAFVTVYRFSQVTRQVWKAARLQSLDVRTDDNGKARRITAQAGAGGLEVRGTQGSYVAPADTVPTGYWNPEIVKRNQALDSHGNLVKVAFAPAGKRTVQVAGRAADAQIYRISGSADGEVGYADDGTWLTLTLNERGNTITYVRGK
jgi:hypothetical protein